MDKRIGAGGIFAIIVGIITLGGVISIAMMKRAVGTVLIMLVGIWAVSNTKGDVFDLIKDFSAKSEASEIRKLEFEREKMKFEAEQELKTRELEIKKAEAESQAKERERNRVQQERIRKEKQAEQDRIRDEQETIRQQKLAEDAAKREAADKVVKAKQSFADNGFKLFEKSGDHEIQYKLISAKWVDGNKILVTDIVFNRTELTTSTKGIQWHSERYTLEINCTSITRRFSNSVVYNGPWTTGEAVMANSRTTNWGEPREWQKNFGNKFCETS